MKEPAALGPRVPAVPFASAAAGGCRLALPPAHVSMFRWPFWPFSDLRSLCPVAFLLQGVYRMPTGRWRAQFTHRNKVIQIGMFDGEEEVRQLRGAVR